MNSFHSICGLLSLAGQSATRGKTGAPGQEQSRYNGRQQHGCSDGGACKERGCPQLFADTEKDLAEEVVLNPNPDFTRESPRRL